MTHLKKNIVFVCIENSNRSQMAEAFARIHGAGQVEAYSSGSRPSGVVNPKAIASMREKGYDLSAHRSKGLTDLPQIEWDAVVTMGCGDECPYIPGKRYIDWDLTDPADRSLRLLYGSCRRQSRGHSALLHNWDPV